MALQAGEPAIVNEILDEEPIMRKIRERVNRRARAAAGGETIPTQVLPEEVLRRRYREVLAGFEKFGTLECIKKHLVDFEEALRDLEVCARCRARELTVLKPDLASPWQQYLVLDCPFGNKAKPWEEDVETHGHVGFYFAIAEESRFSPGPIFRYHNCPGPILRMKQHAARYQWEGDEPPPERKPTVEPEASQERKGDPAWRE